MKIAPKGLSKQKEKNFFDYMMRTKKNYDAFEDVIYDEVLKLTKIRSLPSNSIIIDMGCGAGAWGLRIAKYGYKVIGIDLSYNMMKFAGNFAKKLKVDFLPICSDAEHLPFKSQSSNCIFYGLSLHHIPNIFLSLEEASRCLKNSGKIILFEPNGSNPVRALGNNLGKLLNQIALNQFSSPAERPLSLKEVIKTLEQCGFRNIQVVPHYYVMNNEGDNKLFYVLTRSRNFFMNFAHKVLPRYVGATSFILIAQKAFRYRHQND